MWISNTAAAAMIVPIVDAVTRHLAEVGDAGGTGGQVGQVGQVEQVGQVGQHRGLKWRFSGHYTVTPLKIIIPASFIHHLKALYLRIKYC